MRYLGFICLLFFCSSCNLFKPTQQNMDLNRKIDWQGHRGCRGLMPENTIPAFIKALEFPIQTLELDVAVSKDKQIIVTHEPWFSETICSHPDGSPVTEEEAKKLLIYEMTYEEIKNYDCGLRKHPKYPEQQKLATYKPSFKDMVRAVEAHCKANNIPKVNYDIEIKSQPDYYGKKTPHPDEFVRLMLEEVNELGIKNRMNLQSFDIEILKEIHKQDDSVVMAFLIDNMKGFDYNMDLLDFTPDIYSPYFKFITPTLVKKVHKRGMKLIPWTVNEVKHIQKMLKIGVDGIITDYPNRIEEALKM